MEERNRKKWNSIEVVLIQRRNEQAGVFVWVALCAGQEAMASWLARGALWSSDVFSAEVTGAGQAGS